MLPPKNVVDCGAAILKNLPLIGLIFELAYVRIAM